jgi:hypothetical protein
VRVPELHVYGNAGITRGTEVVLLNPETGAELDLAPWRVLGIERKVVWGEAVQVNVTFLARLVEHEESRGDAA